MTDQRAEPVTAEEIQRIRRAHSPFGIYDECGHDHNEGDPSVIDVEDIGLSCKDGLRYQVCFECDTDDGEVCEWTPEENAWPCDVARVLAALDLALAVGSEYTRASGELLALVTGERDKLRGLLGQALPQLKGFDSEYAHLGDLLAEIESALKEGGGRED